MPHHTDLLENNIHVAPATGRIVGVCDWADARVAPFGVSLGGLESMLGVHRVQVGWCYLPHQEGLRRVFWRALYDAVGRADEALVARLKDARDVGVFLAHGFEYDEQGDMVPAREGEGELAYLEAVTLGLEGQGTEAVSSLGSARG